MNVLCNRDLAAQQWMQPHRMTPAQPCEQAVISLALQVGQGQLLVLKLGDMLFSKKLLQHKVQHWLQSQTVRKLRIPDALISIKAPHCCCQWGFFLFWLQLPAWSLLLHPCSCHNHGDISMSPSVSLHWPYYFQCSCCLSLLTLTCIMNNVTTSWFQASFLTSSIPDV